MTSCSTAEKKQPAQQGLIWRSSWSGIAKPSSTNLLVARVHSGDPAIYGATAEEMRHLRVGSGLQNCPRRLFLHRSSSLFWSRTD